MRLLLPTVLLLAAACSQDSSPPSATAGPDPQPAADRTRALQTSADAIQVAKVAKSETVDTSGWEHRTLRVLGMT